ncbi:hypothetical protein DNTS_008538, partial [Danionella cerebrum]
MAHSKVIQVEKLLDEALKHNNFQALEHLLQDESKDQTSLKCSKHFMTKMDKLFCREIELGNVDNACLVLMLLHKLGEMLVFPGGGGLSMVQWFEKSRKLWAKQELKLAEDFFDALMVCINLIFIRNYLPTLFMDVVKKMPTELKNKKKLLSSQEATSMMMGVASQVLKGGDYDLQVSLMEALCRMASSAQRIQLADSWFSMNFISSAFKKIKDSEFETDCRKFLNMVNGMQGDGRSVYSYPCLEAFLDNHQLLMPQDENLEAFWVDFNLGTQSISFYFSFLKEGQ